MPLLKINAGPEGPRLHLSGACPDRALQEALCTPGPIIIMVHGYKFAPGHVHACPHRHILSLTPRQSWKALSWPRGLGYGTNAPDEGLAIGFGWAARGTLWQAYGRATEAGRQLAGLIDHIHALAPQRPVNLIAHSLGARVVLGALTVVHTGSVGRVVLLNGAEYAASAQAALASKAGRHAEMINVTTRENDLFDFLFERLIRPPQPAARCLAEGFPALPNTLRLQLDHPATRAALMRLGFDVAPDAARICHWSAYLRPGVMEVYGAFLRDPQSLSLGHLRRQIPYAPDPRWSRLWPRPKMTVPAQAWLSPGGTTSNTMNQ